MGKPTPGPWQLCEGDETSVNTLSDAPDFLIAACDGDMHSPDYETATANAAHIVKCVNMHDELLEALKTALAQFNDRECGCDGEQVDGRTVGHACYFHRIEQMFKDAIAKAEGK